MKTTFTFKGMMVPVFTPFNNDAKRTINYDVIDKYAQYLKSMGMHGVFANSMTGEGMTLTVDERKKLAEKWFEVGRKYEMKVCVNIGGVPLPELYELAVHAEQCKFDAVMVLPDLFYKPKTEEDLVDYLKDVMKYVPSVPMFYYHIPMMTEVYKYINFYKFMQMMEKEVPTFAGFFWADDSLDKVMYLREKMPEHHYIIGMGCSMMGFMAEGFDACSMTAMNIYPQMMKEFYDYMCQYKMQDAYKVKEKVYKSIYALFGTDMHVDWLTVMKTEMNKLCPFKVGPLRKPITSTFFF